MKQAILKPKGQYDRGTYTILKGGSFEGYTIWDTQKNGVIADLKAKDYQVFEIDWECEKGSLEFKEIKKKI